MSVQPGLDLHDFTWLTDADLAQIGIENMSHRLQILKAAASLRTAGQHDRKENGLAAQSSRQSLLQPLQERAACNNAQNMSASLQKPSGTITDFFLSNKPAKRGYITDFFGAPSRKGKENAVQKDENGLNMQRDARIIQGNLKGKPGFSKQNGPSDIAKR